MYRREDLGGDSSFAAAAGQRTSALLLALQQLMLAAREPCTSNSYQLSCLNEDEYTNDTVLQHLILQLSATESQESQHVQAPPTSKQHNINMDVPLTTDTNSPTHIDSI